MQEGQERKRAFSWGARAKAAIPGAGILVAIMAAIASASVAAENDPRDMAGRDSVVLGRPLPATPSSVLTEFQWSFQTLTNPWLSARRNRFFVYDMTKGDEYSPAALLNLIQDRLRNGVHVGFASEYANGRNESPVILPLEEINIDRDAWNAAYSRAVKSAVFDTEILSEIPELDAAAFGSLGWYWAFDEKIPELSDHYYGQVISMPISELEDDGANLYPLPIVN